MVHRHMQGCWGLIQTEGEQPGHPRPPAQGRQPHSTVQGPPPVPWALTATSVPTPSRGSVPAPSPRVGTGGAQGLCAGS